MATTISYFPPQIVGTPNINEPKPFLVIPAQGAAFRRGDILVQSTTGSITNPPSVSVGAGLGPNSTAAPPAASAVTIIQSALSGAPAQTYYIKVTYTATSQETLPSQEFVLNCAAGNVPSINVSATGAPAAATNFAAYVGILPGTEVLQQATKTTTALGTPFVCTNPLTNNIGANRGATNMNTNILGIAQHDSTGTFFDGVGGSFLAGQPGSRLGATNTIAPGAPTDAAMTYVTGLGSGQLVEMNLIQTQALNLNLIGTTAGITLDSTTGIFVVDPSQSNKPFTIVDFRQGVYIGPTASGTLGDLGARVIGYFSASSLLLA